MPYPIQPKDHPAHFKRAIINLNPQTIQMWVKRLIVGNSVLESLIAEDGKITLKQCYRQRQRIKRLNRKFANRKIDLDTFFQSHLNYIVSVKSPLALISQIQRSGGSLLSQLFDGHPEIHAHPHEMMIGYKKKYIWPRLDINDQPDRWFGILFEKMIVEHTREGYKKGRRDKERFPFVFIPSLQRKIFLHCVNSAQPETLRDIFNAYMTSYFGAWINNQNYIGPKSLITAFTPRLSESPENMDLFFEIYPDGKLISLIRDPLNWFPSAMRHVSDKYGNLEKAVAQWLSNVQASIRNKERYGERVCILRFEDLLNDTEAVMRLLSKRIGIEFNPILLTPTFNKIPIRAHTSFKVEKHGVVNSPLSRFKTLSRHESEKIKHLTDETYQRVLREVSPI